MNRVAICDKSRKNAEEIRQNFNEKHSVLYSDCLIDIFDTGKELLESPYLEEYQMFLLETDVSDMNGIEIGRQIRNVNKKGVIIFMSETKNYAYDAFRVNAIGYLLKPIDYKELSLLMKYAHRILAYFEMDSVCVKSKEGMVTIYTDEIIAVESEYRKAVYVLKDGRRISTVSNRSTFEKGIMPIPLRENFLQPHKSFFINMDYVSMFRTDGIEMTNGMQIPISREKMQESKKKYREYMQKKL